MSRSQTALHAPRALLALPAALLALPAALLALPAALLASFLLPEVASARRAEPPAPIVRSVRAADLGEGRVARVHTTLGRPRQSGAWLELQHPTQREPLVERRGASATLVAGHGGVLVATATYDTGADRFSARLLRHAGGQWTLGDAHTVARPAAPPGQPFGVSASATADGFAVFFQELDQRDPTLARTFLAHLAPDGTPRGPAAEIPVPWGIADVTWNGNGYHVALIYPGQGDGMRLSMVSLDASGRPQQHPDWSSAAGLVMDVHLVAEGGRVRVYYRGGDGDALLESDVTRIGPWGRDTRSTRRVRELAADEQIVIRRGLDGPASVGVVR